MLIFAIFVLILAGAAVSDLLSYRIPNVAVVALAALFLAVGLIGRGPVQWVDHLAACVVTLGFGAAFYYFNQMGAGDAKLLAAVALWAGFSALLPVAFCVALAGLAFLLVVLAARYVARRRPAAELNALPRVLRSGEGIPYGVAIALGAVVSAHWYPNWIWL